VTLVLAAEISDLVLRTLAPASLAALPDGGERSVDR